MYGVLLDGYTKCGLFQGVYVPSRGVVGVDSEMYTKGMGIPGIDCGVSMSTFATLKTQVLDFEPQPPSFISKCARTFCFCKSPQTLFAKVI